MRLREFGNFTLLDHLGKGGMATVYRAANKGDGSIVALKIFSPTEERPVEIQKKLRRREVRMLMAVQHPNIVKFYEEGQVEDELYYAMEFVEDSLQHRMRSSEDFSLLDKIDVLCQTVSALQAVHRHGLVHRDVKPGNILLDQDPSGRLNVKMTDFGIAKNVSEPDIVRAQNSGSVPGTPKYLSPEQIKMKAVDGRSDIFSLGVVAYEFLSGRAPFESDTTDGYLQANVGEQPTPLHQVVADVPEFISQAVEKMLAKDPEDRYDSDNLFDDLKLVEQQLKSGRPLVETQRPESLFYVSAEEEKEAEVAAEGRRIAPISWAIVVMLAAVGAGVTYALWPAPSGTSGTQKRETVPLPSPEQPSPAELLKQAAGFAEGGQHWRALALLRDLDEEQLAEQDWASYVDINKSVQDSLALPYFEAAVQMLGEGRGGEAEVALERLKSLFPDSGRAAELRDLIKLRTQTAERHDKWDDAIASTQTLARAGDFSGALLECQQLMGSFSDAPERLTRVRQEAVKILERWERSVRTSRASAAALEDYVNTIYHYRGLNWSDVPVPRPAADVYLRLAEIYASDGRYEDSIAYLNEVAEHYGRSDSDRAKTRKAEIEREILSQPITFASLVRELERNGFGSSVWETAGGQDAEHSRSKEALTLKATGGTDEVVSELRTIPPVSNLGFKLSVEFKQHQFPSRMGARATLGLELTNGRSDSITFHFDGKRYGVLRSYAREGGAISGGGALKEAFGDEGETWHTLGVDYEFDSGTVVLRLDGERLADYEVEFSSLGIRLFLKVRGPAECGVTFRKITCST